MVKKSPQKKPKEPNKIVISKGRKFIFYLVFVHPELAKNYKVLTQKVLGGLSQVVTWLVMPAMKRRFHLEGEQPYLRGRSNDHHGY